MESTYFSKDEKRIWGYAVIYIAIILFGTLLCCFITTSPSYTVLEGEGFVGQLNAKVVPLNRYQSSKSGMDTIGYNPMSASNPYYEYLYKTGFETYESNHNWTAGDGGINTVRGFVFQGDQSFGTPRGLATLDFSHTFNLNDTGDIVFYIYPRSNTVDGYITFGFNITYNSQEYQIDFVMQEVGTNLYPVPTPDNHYRYNLTNFQENIWIGYIIEDVRQIMMDIESDSEFEDITIHNIHFNHDVLEADKFYIFVDEFSIHKRPFVTKTGLWYENNVPRTDFYLVIDYIIKVDTDIIDLDTFRLRAEFFANLTAPIFNLYNFAIDIVILPEFTGWTEITNPTDQYNVTTSGSHSSIFYPLPYLNTMGDSITYDFSITYTGGGYGVDSEAYFDSVSEYNFQQNTFDWLQPIDVQ